MTRRDVPGFAIGGLSGGEEKDDFWKMVTLSTNHLPREKPRYLMGVGYVRNKIKIKKKHFMCYSSNNQKHVLFSHIEGTLWTWWCVSL